MKNIYEHDIRWISLKEDIESLEFYKEYLLSSESIFSEEVQNIKNKIIIKKRDLEFLECIINEEILSASRELMSVYEKENKF